MGRNDLCFCMSGKKTKKCHPDIHEGSLAAAKLQIYGKLNDEIKMHRQQTTEESLCIPGCTDCCFDYYTIQSIEFDLILNELKKWDEEELDNLVRKVERYWNILGNDYPEVKKLLLDISNSEIIEINSSIDKTSFPCIFLDETTNLCQIYDVRPFKCRVFGNSFYYPNQEEGAMGIACEKYGSILNDDNFDKLLCDVTEILDENSDLAILHDKKRNIAVIDHEYPLIYHLYKHFIVNKSGVEIVEFDEKFSMARTIYYNKIVR